MRGRARPACRVAGAQQLVLYDGVCGLCNRTVQFLLEVDRSEVLSFAPLQSETASRLLAQHRVHEDLRSVVFIRDRGTPRERALVRSTGALAILSALSGFWFLHRGSGGTRRRSGARGPGGLGQGTQGLGHPRH
ncbi:MAG TPA: DUF393 domain-containing protein [Thermoanaerobaculia bacterium]|nr:DUF393 domain-containing protein [Thermoanaerobaculia bacterium]